MKRTDKNDMIFKNLADKYTDADGSRLNIQSEEPYITNIREPLVKKRKKNIWRNTAAAAAVLLLVVSVAITGNFIFNKNDASTPPEESGNLNNAPLLLLKGDNFTIYDTMEDNGKFIYKINSKNNDDVVVTLEYTALSDISDLNEGVIGGRTVYYKTDYGYNLITYGDSEHTVIMTCRNNMETLKTLYKNMEIIFDNM